MNKYQISEMDQKDNIIFWKCDLCGKGSSQIHWFLIEPSRKYARKGFDERDYACCSELCVNMWILQHI
jgi:hypothetical protein